MSGCGSGEKSKFGVDKASDIENALGCMRLFVIQYSNVGLNVSKDLGSLTNNRNNVVDRAPQLCVGKRELLNVIMQQFLSGDLVETEG